MNTEATKTFEMKLERSIRAKPARVYEAFTTPDQLTAWFAPEGMGIPGAEVDLRVGGRWTVTMKQPDGLEHVAVGEYRELEPPRRLVTTWRWVQETADDPVGPDETLITVDFHEEGDGTRVVMVHEGFRTESDRDNHTQGWSSTFNRLEALFGGGGEA